MDQFGAGTLVTRVANDITQVQNFVSQFVRGMVRCVFLTLGSITFMFMLNRAFGFIMLCAFPFIVGVLAFCLWNANPLFLRLQVQLDRLNSIMQEDVPGLRIIKACVRELYEKARFGKANDELIKTQLGVLVVFSFMNLGYKRLDVPDGALLFTLWALIYSPCLRKICVGRRSAPPQIYKKKSCFQKNFKNLVRFFEM